MAPEQGGRPAQSSYRWAGEDTDTGEATFTSACYTTGMLCHSSQGKPRKTRENSSICIHPEASGVPGVARGSGLSPDWPFVKCHFELLIFKKSKT